MGRIQSSVGLVTGTDIAGTVDQLMKISAQPRDRLVNRTETLREEQQALTELTALVVGVQLAGNRLAEPSLFRSTNATSSDSESLSVSGGKNATPATHVVRTLQQAATHRVRSLRRFESPDDAAGLSGTLAINPPGGFLDESLALSRLGGGRGVEPGTIRVTDRSGASADIELTGVRTIDDVLSRINDAELEVTATTVGDAIRLSDSSGGSGNLMVEQLGNAETAADLGLWGINTASDVATGYGVELPEGVTALRGVALSELRGGDGIGPLGTLDIALADGSTAGVDLSGAATTGEVIDTINASGLPLIARLNEAQNGLQIRDVSGGNGTFSITSADTTAADLGLEATSDDAFIVGDDLQRQSVNVDTPLTDLKSGDAAVIGSFTITDSSGAVGAVNLKTDNITTVGELIDAINGLNVDVTASLNDAGDGIAVVDNAAGPETLTIEDTGSGTAAADLGIAGAATTQLVDGNSVSALVGTSADRIEIDAADSLAEIASKINADSGYASAELLTNGDGTVSLQLRSRKGGEAGRIAVNTDGFELDLRTEATGRDAMIAVSTDAATERLLRSPDGVFEVENPKDARTTVSRETALGELNGGDGIDGGSFTVTDSGGAISAVNLTAEGITTVGELIDAINSRNVAAEASINEAGTGITVIDTAGGDETLTIEDTGNRTAASDLGIAGEATEQTVGGEIVSALVGSQKNAETNDASFSLTLKKLSASPITVTIEEDPEAVVNAVKSFTDQYNKLMEKVDSLTFYDAESDEVGLLFGSSEALRIDGGFKRLLSGPVRGAGAFRSTGQVGIRFQDDGTVELEEGTLRQAISQQPGAVESFFTTDSTGLADRLDALAERTAGVDSSLLISRTETLNSQIERNQSRVESLNERLAAERERLLKQFFDMEAAVAKIQENQQYLSAIRPASAPQPSNGSGGS